MGIWVISEKNIVKTDLEGKILARKYVAKKIPTLKKLAYNDGKKFLRRCMSGKFTIGLGKKFLHKQNHPYTPLYSLQESKNLGGKNIGKTDFAYNSRKNI